MNISQIEKYKKRRNTIKQLLNMKAIFSEATDHPTCDKKGIGFCKDSRFSAFNVKVSFDSWKGSYGNSSCYKVIDFDDRDIVESMFVKFLENHEKEIFKWIADRIQEENEKSKEEVIKELNEQLKMIEEG